MEMIERVARAICESLEADDYASLPEGSIVKAAYRQQAVAAIEAMRDPTPKMIGAAGKALSPGRRPTETWVSVNAKHGIRYRAMIDEALSRPTPEHKEE